MKNKILAEVLLLSLLLTGVSLAKDPPTDDKIYNDVIIKLTRDEVVKGGALKVDIKDGVVTLNGSVEEEKQKEKATKVAKGVKGVKQVINNITIRSKNAPQ
jgi:osmotically-inducible protein OsmY